MIRNGNARASPEPQSGISLALAAFSPLPVNAPVWISAAPAPIFKAWRRVRLGVGFILFLKFLYSTIAGR